MDRVSAEDIGRKARALKHCIKVLGTIEKKGSAEIVLNCTGVKLVAHKNDALHLKIATTKAQLEEEIASYEIVRASTIGGSTGSLPAALTPEEKTSARNAKKAAYINGRIRKQREAPAT